MILRTELRRSAAPVICIGLVVFALGLLYGLTGPWVHGNAPWNEQWTGLAQWPRHLMVFLWPLVLGAGAWQGLRDKRSHMTELLASTPRPASRRVLPLLGALALALLAGYVVLMIIGGVQVAIHASYFTFRWLPVAGVMVLALAGIAFLGVGIGRLVPSLLTPPVAAILALALEAPATVADWQLLLTPAFDGVDINVFMSVAPTVSLTQALWFIGIGATGFGLVVAARTRTRLVALLPVAVAAAVTVPVLSGMDSPVVADPDARALVCDDNVCVTRAHEDYLPTLTGPARSALTLLRKLPQGPTSVVEVSPYADFRLPPPDVAYVFVDESADESLPPELADQAKIKLYLLHNVFAPGCRPELNGWDDYVENSIAGTVAVGWLTGELTPRPDEGYLWKSNRERLTRVWETFRALPADEQRDRVVALRAAARGCKGDLLSIVTAS